MGCFGTIWDDLFGRTVWNGLKLNLSRKKRRFGMIADTSWRSVPMWMILDYGEPIRMIWKDLKQFGTV